MSTFLKRGRLLAKDSKLRGKLIWFKAENMALARDACARYRCEDVDGEFRIIGRRGHAWEYGRHKLGFSVEGKRVIRYVERQVRGWATRTQRGDDEANFRAPWQSRADLDRLAAVLRFYARRNQARKLGSFVARRGVSLELQPAF
ncbi:MAG: hypothetical protein HZC54_24775 [Verrucomicrobia bacterium]|nr:hypothetical protein [Verrucomicrobiota bacterium]